MSNAQLEAAIEAAWDARDTTTPATTGATREAIEDTLAALDKGALRVAEKQADGSWKKLVDPANKGGDENIYYEDKWAFLWPATPVRNFEKQGCTVACHVGEGKP